MNLNRALIYTMKEIQEAAGDCAPLEARFLLGHALNICHKSLAAYMERILTEDELNALVTLIERRKAREPLQYILGEWEFMGLPFTVREGALIPRQETETLVELALKLIHERNYKTALDLCCGTGCIGVSLAKLGGVSVTFCDIMDDCINLTRENANKNGVAPILTRGSYFDSISGSFDMILCNPPYIRSADIAQLQQEISFEPKTALDGGEDGLDAYRAIRKAYKRHLNDGGVIIMEIGDTQAQQVKEIFGENTEIHRDLNGLERIAICD